MSPVMGIPYVVGHVITSFNLTTYEVDFTCFSAVFVVKSATGQRLTMKNYPKFFLSPLK